MNTSQRIEAKELAQERIESGTDPDHLVHILYYPDNYSECDDTILGISSTITPEEFSKGGLVSKYYSLRELVSFSN